MFTFLLRVHRSSENDLRTFSPLDWPAVVAPIFTLPPPPLPSLSVRPRTARVTRAHTNEFIYGRDRRRFTFFNQTYR